MLSRFQKRIAVHSDLSKKSNSEYVANVQSAAGTTASAASHTSRTFSIVSNRRVLARAALDFSSSVPWTCSRADLRVLLHNSSVATSGPTPAFFTDGMTC